MIQQQEVLQRGLTSHCCTASQPVPHSHQLLNHIVDCRATRKSQALFAEYPRSPTSYNEGFIKITYGKLANAVDRIAWWLVDQLGQGNESETVAYIGPNDIVYPALILGAIKAGYKTLLLAPGNSIEAQLHLLKETKCKAFIKPEPCPPPVTAILKALNEDFRVLIAPSVDNLLEPLCKPFEYNVSYEEGKDVTLAVLHTSGSTGLPKPIVLKQAFVAAYAKILTVLPPPGFESLDQLYEANRIFLVSPPFHGSFVAQLINAITCQTALIFPLRGEIPSAYSLAEIAKHTRVDAAMVVPVMVEEISRSQELLQDVSSRIDTLVYAGGDVPQGCGDIVAERMRLMNLYGSTETASLGLIGRSGEYSSKDWKYLSFHPYSGTEFRHHSDDKYELFIVRKPELAPYQPVFITFPELEEYKTKDLYRQHPTKPHLWKHCGRADDTIVLLTGKKITPVDAEQTILSSNPEITGVLMTGQQRFQPALLIEIVATEEMAQTPKSDLVQRFWPSIQKANKSLPAHGQIAKTHILFIDSARPMQRSGKATIKRSATLADYATDFDKLYDSVDQIDESATAKVCDITETAKVSEFLGVKIEELSGQRLDVEDNFFAQGIDSLQALLLVRELRRQVSGIAALTPHLVYNHPTIKSMISAMQKLAEGGDGSQLLATNPSPVEISTTLAKFTEQIDKLSSTSARKVGISTSHTYLLTGSTGSLGSYILDTLLQSDAAHIYCLNRSSDSGATQVKKNSSRGLSTNLPSDRVTFLTADLSKPRFGLDADVYTHLSGSVTHIIHAAWSVNFNIPLSTYDPQLQGVTNLVDFSNSAAHAVSLLYVSSISAVAGSTSDTIEETLPDESSAAAVTGYGASKYIAEHLLDHAAQHCKLNMKIARVGQIAGPLGGTGIWNRSEWLPSVVRSSAEVGVLPESLGASLNRVDWIPVDQLATSLLEMTNSTNTTNSNAKVLNVVNPQVIQWTEVSSAVSKALSSVAKADVQVVPFEEWIAKIKARFETDQKLHDMTNVSMEEMLAANPAAKLLDFYDGAYNVRDKKWQTAEAEGASPTLKSLGPIQVEWIEKWMKGWF